jgi:hypothetical protein
MEAGGNFANPIRIDPRIVIRERYHSATGDVRAKVPRMPGTGNISQHDAGTKFRGHG